MNGLLRGTYALRSNKAQITQSSESFAGLMYVSTLTSHFTDIPLILQARLRSWIQRFQKPTA